MSWERMIRERIQEGIFGDYRMNYPTEFDVYIALMLNINDEYQWWMKES